MHDTSMKYAFIRCLLMVRFQAFHAGKRLFDVIGQRFDNYENGFIIYFMILSCAWG